MGHQRPARLAVPGARQLGDAVDLAYGHGPIRHGNRRGSLPCLSGNGRSHRRPT
jgi:hypothetical protein